LRRTGTTLLVKPPVRVAANKLKEILADFAPG
jgi:hypothetical protein